MLGAKIFKNNIIALTCFTVLSSCGGGGSGLGIVPSKKSLAEVEQELHSELDSITTDANFTLLIESDNGNEFIHRRGTSSENTLYESASTSKLVTAAVILRLVEAGDLSLDDNPQDYISGWPTTGNLSEIQLRHLLSFTSGLRNEPACLNFPGAVFANCVDAIATLNAGAVTPGSDFYYSSSHLQVAGLMAINASGATDWTDVFAEFKTATGLFTDGIYNLPSLQNPRLAGGMVWTAREYVDFLRGLVNADFLSEAMIETMTSDQLEGVTISFSPAINGIGQDWHYGFGVWLECNAATYDCVGTTRVSSPGAYGAYPFIDFENRYYGIIARQGGLGTFDEGYAIFQSVQINLENWANLANEENN